MNRRRVFICSQMNAGLWRFPKSLALVAIALMVMGTTFVTLGQGRGPEPSPQNPAGPPRRDLGPELALKITAPFTIAAVGDIIAPLPLGTTAEPGYENLVKIIRSADVGFANMESSLVDMSHFQGPLMGTLAPKEVGVDIKAMGITMMSRANNHAFDGTEAGMISTDETLDALGIVHAGTGKDLNEARAVRFLATPKGRVGLVGMVSIDNTVLGDPGSTYVYMSATYRSGDLGGRAGVNALRLTAYHVVTPEQLQTLRGVRDAVVPAAPNGGGGLTGLGGFGVFATAEQTRALSTATDRLRFFDSYFEAGTTPGTINYEVNADDERDVLRSIRNGKLYTDFLIATIHAHQGHQNVNGVRTVSDWLTDLAHKSIDSGADIFIVHGPHELGGVEIYKGKPIFYGMSSFVFQSDIQISSSDKATLSAPRDDPPGLADGGGGRTGPGQEGLLATSHYEGGRLTEIRLYPVDLGITRRPMSLMGLPLTPSPEIAQRMLEEMQALSKPFGTKIDIEGGVGVIHVGPTAGETGSK
jgi:poly-gamma-glutamate capsule biosynthesis protein CapA/YwtB (metallophosphatase superfamily)